MVICPKCNQPSQSDKICSNCWADLKVKPTKKNPRDLTKMPLKNIFILTAMVVAFGFFLMIMGKVMSPSDNDQNNNSVNNSK
jgi:multisubunit Na+/H+ antiporter MnhC subunit